MPSASVLSATIDAAVAHELNNELTIVLSGVGEVLEMLEPGDPARAILIDISKAAQRSAWCMNSLLSMAQRKGGEPSAVLVKDLIDGQ